MDVIGFLLAVLLCGPAATSPAPKIPVFVSASFLDRNRLHVENLSRDEIRITENGAAREVEYFAGTEVPVAYGLLIDRSLLLSPFEDLRPDQYRTSSATAAPSVAYKLVDLCLGRQAGWVAGYDDKGMQEVLDFTPDSSRVKEAIQQLQGIERPTQESALYGPLLSAVQKLSQRHEKRRVLVLFVGMIDIKTADRIKPLKNLLSATNVELFVAGFAPKTRIPGGLQPPQNEAVLRDMAEVTAGGAYFSAMEGIEGLGRRIADQVRTLYTVGYQSESDPDNPARLTIECSRPGVKVKSHPVSPILQK